MSDFAEDAERQEELARQVALSFRHPKGPQAIGICLNCDAPLPVSKNESIPPRWCCIECHDDWCQREGQ